MLEARTAETCPSNSINPAVSALGRTSSHNDKGPIASNGPFLAYCLGFEVGFPTITLAAGTRLRA